MFKHVWCDAKGVSEKIGVQLVTGDERKQVLEQRKDVVDRLLMAHIQERTRCHRRRARVGARLCAPRNCARAIPRRCRSRCCAARDACRRAAHCGWCGGRASSRFPAFRRPGSGDRVQSAARFLGQFFLPARESRCWLLSVHADAAFLHGTCVARTSGKDGAAWSRRKDGQVQAAQTRRRTASSCRR